MVVMFKFVLILWVIKQMNQFIFQELLCVVLGGVNIVDALVH